MQSAAPTPSSDPVPSVSMFSLVLDQPEPPHICEFADAHKTFRVRCADTDGHRSSVSVLVDTMYAWRQYESSYRFGHDPNRIVLAVLDHDRAVATSTLGLDSEIGLLADELYKDEVDSLRRDRRRLCEITKLAIDHVIRSKRVLASLFHISLIYAYHLHRRTDCLIRSQPAPRALL